MVYKNSTFVWVLRSRESIISRAWEPSRPDSTLRSFHIIAVSSRDSSNSSRRVPDASTSIAGNSLLLANSRRSRNSILPVPLNSSKITSSIFDPVSTRAVARIVRDPPCSILRAAPKNFFGGYRAAESTPPERIRPEAGAAKLYARPRRVMPSSKMTTS